MKPPLNTTDPDELAGDLNDFFDHKCEELSKDSTMIIEPHDRRFELDPEDHGFQWTNKAQKIIEKMRDRLQRIWNRHFPDEELEIYSNWFIEE